VFYRLRTIFVERPIPKDLICSVASIEP
jgi:hypothetical protein